MESGLQCYAQSIMGMVDTQRVNVEAALAIAVATMGKITNCVSSHFNRLKKIQEITHCYACLKQVFEKNVYLVIHM